jgi:hypothetical protein
VGEFIALTKDPTHGYAAYVRRVIEMEQAIRNMQACIDMADKFFSEVLPQASKLVFQDYAMLNELGIALTKLKSDGTGNG